MTVAMHQILLVEDDPGIRGVLRVLLESERYRVIEAETAERADIEARSHRPDLLLLDLGLPDRDGLDVIERLRRWSQIPVIVLSARTMEGQKIAALDAGADDYVSKPFAANELLARIRAGLRRSQRTGSQPPRLRIGAIEVDLGTRTVLSDGADVHLTPLEFRVLECLARQAGMIATTRQLLREVWGPDRGDETGALRVCIKGLRDKLEPDPHRPRHLVTEPGIGYRLRADEAT